MTGHLGSGFRVVPKGFYKDVGQKESQNKRMSRNLRFQVYPLWFKSVHRVCNTRRSVYPRD